MTAPSSCAAYIMLLPFAVSPNVGATKGMGLPWQWCLSQGVIAACVAIALKLLDALWWRPRRVERHFAQQGVRGPPYCFFIGCIREMTALMPDSSSKPTMPLDNHNILPRVLPFYHHWKNIYGTLLSIPLLLGVLPFSFIAFGVSVSGSPFLLWFGATPRLAVSDPELIREILLARSDVFERYAPHPVARQLEGDGLVNLRDKKWAHHRKVLTPTFHMDNLKVGPVSLPPPSLLLQLLMPFIGKSVLGMVEGIPSSGEEVEINVSEWFQTVAEEVVTQATFGRSYDEGKAVFQLQSRQMTLAAEAFRNVFIPGFRFLPTKTNTNSWKLEKEIGRRLVELISRRRERPEEEKGSTKSHGNAKDLLGLMIDAGEPKQRSTASSSMTVGDIVEECKTFFFAGKQTTSNLLTWMTVLLAMHQEWQERAREEVLRVCGGRDVPSWEHLPKLKTLGMIIHETLRLYPPAVATIREAKRDVVLGGYWIPSGTEILIPIMGLHHDAELWGSNVAAFSPERFADGAACAARHPTAFLPFGLGPRMCIGQNLAILEAKLTMAVLLQRFAFRLSPSYVHAPTVLMLLYPQYGAPVIFRPLTS
ncbi:hypothetical protein ZIOFF_016232 [Zingiber officinale]|uniref:Cytochrome P450 n=1 Tax=Zingiber officinale TaxID=94328 RepID=A0A8J5HL12_ZINOF|nr:hypothetical protein ZIOFF_016232 [Zingiber officinale]